MSISLEMVQNVHSSTTLEGILSSIIMPNRHNVITQKMYVNTLEAEYGAYHASLLILMTTFDYCYSCFFFHSILTTFYLKGGILNWAHKFEIFFSTEYLE